MHSFVLPTVSYLQFGMAEWQMGSDVTCKCKYCTEVSCIPVWIWKILFSLAFHCSKLLKDLDKVNHYNLSSGNPT